jgi:inosine-uridine nucleoside N-ribohydrolase
MSWSSRLPVAPRCRVILDNDWSGDPDGLVALAHHLLSPGNSVVAVTSSFLNPVFASPIARAADGALLAEELVRVVGGPTPIVHAGCEEPFGTGRTPGAAAETILAESGRDDSLPLYLVCGGPLTNVASALAAEPGLVNAIPS